MEATTTLADSLLEDLDDLSDVEEGEGEGLGIGGGESDDGEGGGEGGTAFAAVAGGDDGSGGGMVDVGGVGGGGGGAPGATVPENGGAPDAASASVAAASDAARKPPPPAASLRRRRLLLDDPALNAHLVAVRSSRRSADSKVAAGGGRSNGDGGGGDRDAEEEERRLIVDSNRHLRELQTELGRAHSDLCLAYRAKFPELEELLPNPVQYRKAVGVIGNEMDLTKVNDGLNDVLNSNQILTVSVAGSTTSGRPLTDDEMRRAEEAGSYLDRVRDVQSELTSFVESGMESLAPSVCALVGASVAARLMGLAGGLAELSRVPACNLQVLGQTRQGGAARGGMGTAANAASRPHTGVLGDCDLVARCPAYLRRKALKAVAAKLALAARCDYVNVESGRPRSASSGRKFRAEVEEKIRKWEEPDRAPVVKALPKPDLTTKKRRGGKRIRRLKERFEETEMMKQANTRAFLKETGEYGDDSMGMTLGMLDAKEGGGVRRTVEKRRMRQANTKASRKRAVQMSSGATSGLASSMVFTPVQGLELVNPDANKERVRDANLKWFGENAGFQSALPKKG